MHLTKICLLLKPANVDTHKLPPSPNIHTYLDEKTSSGEKVLGLVPIVSDWVTCPWLNQKDGAL